MIVVLDTEPLYGDCALEKAVRLSNELASRGGRLILPSVVLDELGHQFVSTINDANKYVKTVNDNIREANRALGRLRSFVKDTKEIPSIDVVELNSLDIINGRAKYIEKLLDENSIVEQSYPELRPLVKRGREYLKPFGKAKVRQNDIEVGYRDAAIWQSVINIALENETESVVFISGNTNDFADADKKSLHPDLLSDLSSLNIQSRVTYLLSIGELENREFYDTILSFGSLEDVRKYHPNAFERFDTKVLEALQDYSLMPSLDINGITEENEIDEIKGDEIDVLSCEKTWGRDSETSHSIKFSLELQVTAKIFGYTSLEEYNSNQADFLTFSVINEDRYHYEPIVRVEFYSDLGVLLDIVYSEESGATYSISKVVPLRPNYHIR